MFGIFEVLDYILPSTDRSKHDISRLEYLSACKIMENENNILKILPQIPSSMYESLLQSVIYKCYLEFINIGHMSVQDFHRNLEKREIAFPETLRILILNWPRTELVLRNQIPPLHPPVEIFQSYYGALMNQKQCVRQVEDMLRVFELFCTRLIRFITQTFFKCTPRNTQGFSCKLRRLDVSGLGSFCSQEDYYIMCFSLSGDILKDIRNSKIDNFGHKVEIFADAQFDRLQSKGYVLLNNIVKESLNPNFGISVFFKKISVRYNDGHLSSDVCNVLALGRCEYIKLDHLDIDRNFAETLCSYLPKLLGINMPLMKRRSRGPDFLDVFKSLEQIGLGFYTHNDLINSISNMSKGLKYLNLLDCSLLSKDLKCLANSIHSDTLLELNLKCNHIGNDSAAEGLIMLCQKLNNVKVLTVERCSLNTLSSNSLSKVVNAFKDCVTLEFLSMIRNPFSVEKINIIINSLAQNKSLRYISLDLPELRDNLGKIFHEMINKFRDSPIYISWSTSAF